MIFIKLYIKKYLYTRKMNFKCNYCNKILASQSSLNVHLKRAKYCINKRSEKNTNFECNGCDKKYTSKQNLNIHMENCVMYQIKLTKENYIKEINFLNKKLEEKDIQLEEQKNQYEIKIQQLQDKLHDKLENIAIKAVQRPTTTNMNKTQINNFIQRMEPLSVEHMLEHSQNLTLEHIQKGASGYAEYALEYPLKDRIACVDYSRRKMKFKDKDGNLITDPEMVKLAPMFFNSIKNKSSEIVYSQNDPNMDSVMFEEVAKLFNTNTDVKNGASGIKSEFYHDFIKHVCSGSVVE